MTTAQLLARAALAFAGFLLVGHAFARLAWYAFRRWGARGLLLTWAASSVGATALMVARIHQQQAVIGFTAAEQQRISLVPVFLPLWATVLGAVALVIQRGKFAASPAFSMQLTRATTAALLAATLVYFVVLAWLDVLKLFRWP